jgi:ELWxxDGT repeat protein
MNARRPLSAAVALLLAFAIPVRAVTAIPEITVIDIYPGGDNASYALDKGTTGQVAVGNRLFFSADSASGSSQLWVSDGTTSGTHLVKTLSPSGADEVSQIVAFGDSVMFRANDEVHGIELWISDGTESGTNMVKDINTVVDEEAGDSRTFNSYPQNLYLWGSVLYFAADDGINGVELWKSDGTESGTVLVENISSDGNSYPADFQALGSKLLFDAQDSTNGLELWSTDGTAAGTQMVRDINTSGNSYPYQLVKSGNVVFFMAENGDYGYELWKSDGTEGGTVLVADLLSGPQQGYISGRTLTAFNGGVVFRRLDFGGTTGSELWKSDGTAVGTVIVRDINPGAGHSEPESLSVMGNTVYFSANDGVAGTELWRSDGTEAGTEMVKDIWEGADSGASPIENSGIVSNGVHAYFFAEAPNSTGGDDKEIWRTDGTAAGTVQIGVSGLHSQSFCDNCNTPGVAIAGNRVFFRTWTETVSNELGAFVDDSLPRTNRDGGGGAQLLVLAAGLTAAASLAVRRRERRAN